MNKWKYLWISREQASSVVLGTRGNGSKKSESNSWKWEIMVYFEVTIERKTTEDFLTSMIDGRLFNQLKNMSESYQSPVIIL